MNPDFWIGLCVGVAVFVVNALVRRDAPQRHARYRMRAKLARWLYDGKLTPATARKGKLVMSLRRARRKSAAKRDDVLSLVRRDDASA